MVEPILESINDNALLKPLLEGHVLSYDGNTDGVTGIRRTLGLPVTGTDFSDATGLIAVLAKGIENLFGKNAGRGNGAGWEFTSQVRTFSNWVDGVFFGTSYHNDGSTSVIAPFVLGVPSGSNPAGVEGTAVWTGPVVGRKLNPIGHLEGNATLTYDFGDANLDVLLDSLLYYPSGLPPTEAVSDITWEDLPVSNGVFGDCSGSGNCVRGRFFDDNEGNAAESVGGVFRNGSLRGAFGAER